MKFSKNKKNHLTNKKSKSFQKVENKKIFSLTQRNQKLKKSFYLKTRFFLKTAYLASKNIIFS